MNVRFTVRFAGALVVILAAAGCQTGGPGLPPTQSGDVQDELAASRQKLRRYEERYGKLPADRPKPDFRKVRAQLKGKPASAVVEMLGKPAKVFTMGASESWDYANAAFDPVSGRTVRSLEIWFRNGQVDYMTASY